LDALAMGVPVLTCPNNLYAGAISASLLESIGLDTMVSRQVSQLPETAAGLYTQYRSPKSRHQLAAFVRNSPLCNTAVLPRHFSAALTSMLKRVDA
jgi:predicted O-linked N-acetylglucosamine transferase (SPINDLY family)